MWPHRFMYIGDQKMKIRALAAAAAIFAMTTPVLAESHQNASVGADSLASLADTVKLGGFAIGVTPIVIAGAIAAFVTVTQNADGTTSTVITVKE